jgi:hypothetical protein
MTRSIINAAVLASVACFCLNAEPIHLKMKVPFEFRMGEVRMPAGVYMVSEDRGIVKVRNAAGSPTAIYVTVPTSRRTSNAAGSMEFKVYNGEHFLHRLWEHESHRGLIVPKGKYEKEVARRSTDTTLTAVALERK